MTQSLKLEKSSTFYCHRSDEDQSVEVSLTDQSADRMLLIHLQNNMEEKLIVPVSDFLEPYNIPTEDYRMLSVLRSISQWCRSPFVFLVCNMRWTLSHPLCFWYSNVRSKISLHSSYLQRLYSQIALIDLKFSQIWQPITTAEDYSPWNSAPCWWLVIGCWSPVTGDWLPAAGR